MTNLNELFLAQIFPTGALPPIPPVPPPPPEDYGGLQGIIDALDYSVESLRANSQAPRDGDFTRSPGLGDAYAAARGHLTGFYASPLRALLTISALRMEAQVHITRGRFLRELKLYREADAQFAEAYALYDALLNGRPVPATNDEAEVRIHTYARSINPLIVRELSSQDNMRIEMQIEMADLQILMISPDEIITDEMIYRHLGEDEFNRSYNNFQQKIRSLRNRLTPENGKQVESASLRLAPIRSFITEVNLLLELAKRLRVRNMEYAHRVVEEAITILMDKLNSVNGIGNPEVALSALLSLAWAYNTKASLMEEQESGSGQEYALKAAAIYTFLLFGQGRISGDEDLNHTLQNSPELQTLFAKYSGEMGDIRESLTSVLSSGRIDMGTDILKRNGTNELELYLNLANSLSLARKYLGDDGTGNGTLGAINILDKIRTLESDFTISQRGNLENRRDSGNILRDSFFYRVRLAEANIEMAYYSRLYGETRDLGLLQKFQEIEAELRTTLSWFSQKVNGLQNAGADIKEIDQYSLDFFRGYDTLAWVYSTLGRIQKNEQGIWDGMAETDYLALAENYYRAIRLEDGETVTGDENVNLANRLCREMRGFDNLSDRLIKMEMETYITWPQVYLRRGEIERTLENFEDALAELGQLTVDDSSYYSAQLSIAEIKLVQAQRIFSQTGEVEQARQMLDQLLLDPTLSSLWSDDSPAPATRRILAHLLKARIHEALGRLTLETMDRAAADAHFGQALALYDELIAKEWIHELMAEELFITVDQLRLARAEVLKARGERDLDFLTQAETAFAALSFDPASLRGMEAEISRFEELAIRNKYYITEGLYHELPSTLTAEEEARLQEIINDLLGRSAYRLAYRTMSVYAWLVNQRARFREVTEGEGQGREDYEKAAQIYETLLAHPLLSDNRFLILSNTSRGQIALAQAESLKSAAIREADAAHPLSRSADAVFELALTWLSELEDGHQLYYITALSLLDGQSGRAENRITLGQLQEEEGSLDVAEASYREALGCLAPVLGALIARPPVRYLTESRVGLRATSALTWVLNSLGEWRENAGFDVDIENAPAEYRAALLIYSALIGNPPGRWAVRDEELPLGIELSGLLGFIRGTQTLTNEEVLYAAEQSRWAARFGYLAALNSSKMFGFCLNAYSELVRDIGAWPAQGIFELGYAIRAHALMGDVNTFRLASDDNRDAYRTAGEIYEKALDLLDEYLNRFHLNRLPREMEEIRQYINSGYAKVLIEGGRYDDAKARYQAILDCPLFADPNREITFKQFKILVQAYLGLGNLHTHYIRDGEEALRYFNIALQLLNLEDDRAPVRRMRGDAHLGMGNAYFLRFRDFSGALAQFSEGIKALTGLSLENFTLDILGRIDRKSREILVRLLNAAATVYAEIGDRENCERYTELAYQVINSIPEDRYEPDREEIEEQFEESVVGNAETLAAQALSLEPYAGYRRTAFESEATEGFLAGFLGHAALTHDLNLDFGYANVMSPSPIPLNDEIERLTFDRSHQANLGLGWQAYEGDTFDLRLTPRFSLNYFDYRVNQYDSTTSSSNWHDQSLSTYGLGLGAELFWNTRLTPDWTLVWGGGIDTSFLIRQGIYPSYQAQITSFREQIASWQLAARSDPRRADEYNARAQALDDNITRVEEQNDSFLFSFLASPRISLVKSPWHILDDFMMYYPTFTLGGLIGYDQISVTEQGRWPLHPIRTDPVTDALMFDPETGALLFSEIDPFRWAVTAGFHTTLAWGDRMQYRLPITTNVQYGNFFYFDINAGFNFGLDWFDFMAGYSHYQDDRQNVVDNLNLGLRFLLPGF